MPYYPPTGDAGTSLTAYSLLGNSTGSTAPGTSVQTLTLGTPGFALSGGMVLAQITGASATFAEFDVQNTTTGATASTDIVVDADNATATTNYGNFGINSSTFTGSGAFNQPGYTYLTATSGDLAVGTTTANAIHFVVNNGATDALTISAAGALTVPTVGAASTPAMTLSGAPYSGGSATTNFPLLYLNSGAAPTTFSANGTIIGGNSPSGFTGNFLDYHLNGGASLFKVASDGTLTASPSLNTTGFIQANGNFPQLQLTKGGTGDQISGGLGSGVLQFGNFDAASPVAQILQVQNVSGGTSNTSGVNWTNIASLATGSGTPGDMIFQTGYQGIALSATATFTNSSANIGVTNTFTANQAVQFTTTGTLPTNFATATTYYVISTSLSGSNVQVSATVGGAAITAGSAGSGVQTLITATVQQTSIKALTVKGGTQNVLTNTAGQILGSSVSITGGGTGNVPTLTSGPVTGNPTKWLPYNDNGTTRYIPSW